jgi:hypothetical protein
MILDELQGKEAARHKGGKEGREELSRRGADRGRIIS